LYFYFYFISMNKTNLIQYISLLIFLLFIRCNTSFSQEWTEPINISSMNGVNQTPDLFIDKNGNLHCVWAHVVNDNFSNIYYSKSIDNGFNWSSPQNISQNIGTRPINPKIVSDDNLKLYVSYDNDMNSPTNMKILMRTFDGTSWSLPDTASGDMYHCHQNKLVIDNSGRIYCFWNHAVEGGDYYYRYLENGVWSETFHPYSFGMYGLAFKKIVPDADNNLQCLGNMFEGNTFYVYIKFDYLTNQWSDTLQICNKTTGDGDIDLDNNDYVHFTWRHKTPGTPNPMEEDSTLYRYFDGNSWTTPEVVTADPWSQKLQLINNKAYIIDWEKSEGNYGNIIMYEKNEFGNWIGELVITEAANTLVFIKSENELFFLYGAKPDEDNINVYYMHKIVDTTTTISESNFTIQSLEIFPNPSSCSTNISFTLLKERQVVLKVYTFKGELVKTIIEKDLPEGFYQMNWDCTNNSNINVKPGAYLVRLMAGRNIISRSVVISY
jgi:hypothetical protein